MTKTQYSICLSNSEVRIKSLQDKVAELEKERDIRDLEQQAKGIELLIREDTSVGRLHNGDKRSFIFCQDAKIRAFELLGKAKALKGKDND
jgi:hypothetical protein